MSKVTGSCIHRLGTTNPGLLLPLFTPEMKDRPEFYLGAPWAMSVPLQSPGGPCSPLMDPADRVPGGGGVSAARVWPASSRPCQIPEALLRGRVPPDEQNKFMEMFSQGRFSSAGLRFREKHRLEGKQSWLLRGSKHRLPCPSPAPTALLPLPLFPAPPSVPREA